MSEFENNCSVSISVVDGGMIQMVVASEGSTVALTQNIVGAHRVACDLLSAINQIQCAELMRRKGA